MTQTGQIYFPENIWLCTKMAFRDNSVIKLNNPVTETTERIFRRLTGALLCLLTPTAYFILIIIMFWLGDRMSDRVVNDANYFWGQFIPSSRNKFIDALTVVLFIMGCSSSLNHRIEVVFSSPPTSNLRIRDIPLSEEKKRILRESWRLIEPVKTDIGKKIFIR